MSEENKKFPWFCPMIKENCNKKCWCFRNNQCKNPMLNEESDKNKGPAHSVQARYKKGSNE